MLFVARLYLVRAAWSGAQVAGDAFRQDIATRLQEFGCDAYRHLLPEEGWKDVFDPFFQQLIPGDEFHKIGIRRSLQRFIGDVECRLKKLGLTGSDATGHNVNGLQVAVEIALMRLIGTSDSIRVYGKVRYPLPVPEIKQGMLRITRCLAEAHLVLTHCQPLR